LKSALFVLAALLTAACSTTPSTQSGESSADGKTAANVQDDKGVICTYEKPTGSFLKEKRCTTAAERQAERDHQNSLMDVRNSRDSGL